MTFVWGEMTRGEMTMGRSDRIPNGYLNYHKLILPKGFNSIPNLPLKIAILRNITIYCTRSKFYSWSTQLILQYFPRNWKNNPTKYMLLRSGSRMWSLLVAILQWCNELRFRDDFSMEKTTKKFPEQIHKISSLYISTLDYI